MDQMLGLVALCKVRHVYSADRMSVYLVNSAGEQTHDDLTLQLPVLANTIMRPGDPPLMALKLFDPLAADGKTSDAPGPCPAAAKFTRRVLTQFQATLMHVPIPARDQWLDGLQPGSIEIGDLYLLPIAPDPESIAVAIAGAKSLSRVLVDRGFAKARHDAA
jgi:hypothetical protein